MNLSDEVDLEDYVSRPDKISAGEDQLSITFKDVQLMLRWELAVQMAASATMQYCVVSPIMSSGLIKNYSSNSPVSFPSKRVMSVRCYAEEKQGPQEQVYASTPITPSNPTSTPLPQNPNVSMKFSDILAFSAPAQERINGWLAMVGFVAELASENELFIKP